MHIKVAEQIILHGHPSLKVCTCAPLTVVPRSMFWS